ncbi:MAG: ABC transporter ATP-binding protein, partial [Fimbriimonadaceae bacterium]|nr:ABC transporter ATP-binding protein [Alphaproteobacteria bacterium]
ATVELRDVRRTFIQGPREIEVLRGVDLALQPGETVALVGPSGAGKSTLLHIAGLLERPNSGAVIMDGVDCVQISDRDRTRIRRFEIGFVYQSHRLLPEFSALENVILPQRIAGLSAREARERAMALLAMLDLSPRADHRPAELSGGEQQRVAIARAVANAPRLLLADEPTGNLDVDTGERVFNKLLSIVRESGLAALIATHNLDLAARMDRIVHLEHGHLVEKPVG